MSMLVATPLVVTAASTHAQAATDKPGPIRVLSYNLRGPGAAHKQGDKGYYSWRARRERQVRLVLDQDPAIFGVQEASTNKKARPRVRAKSFLVPRYRKAGYSAFTPRGGSPKIVFWKKARFAKMAAGKVRLGAIDDCTQKRRSMTWVLLRERVTNQRYFVANVHFATKPECLSTRVQSAQVVHATIAANNPDNAPVIVMGDFNNRQRHCYASGGVSRSKPLRVLGEPRNDVHRHNLDITSPSGCRRTTHGNWPNARPAPGDSRIDFIFHSKALVASHYKVVAKRTLPIRKKGKKTGAHTSASDHYPIVADFRLR